MNVAESFELSEQDYLHDEYSRDIKHEYIDGQAYAMVGASESHNIISGNVFAQLHRELKKSGLKGKGCKTFIADMKVKASGNIFYPDLMVICEPDPNDSNFVKNTPSIIVEVLSASTRKNDITLKKMAYMNIASLQEYVLIEQDKFEVVVFRKSQHWASTYYVLGDEITFESIDVIISVADIYDGVEGLTQATA